MKRQLYGRADFELLRKMILLAWPARRGGSLRQAQVGHCHGRLVTARFEPLAFGRQGMWGLGWRCWTHW